MILADTNDLIRVISSTTGDIEVSADWVDWTASTFTPGHTTTLITTATTTTIVAAPAASTQRQVKAVVVANRHASTAMGITVEHFDNTNAAAVWKGDLAAGESVVFDGQRWHRYTASGYLAAEVIVDVFDYWIRAATDRTLASQTAEQPMFNVPTNGRFTAVTGVYVFDWQFVITAMSATSGNARFDFLGAGTAVLGDIVWSVRGLDNTAPDTIASDLAATFQVDTSAASVVTAGTGTALRLKADGIFQVNTAGTVQPALALVTAAAAVVQNGSYFRARRVGDVGMTAIGPWD